MSVRTLHIHQLRQDIQMSSKDLDKLIQAEKGQAGLKEIDDETIEKLK